jgi:hypothetical protein
VINLWHSHDKTMSRQSGSRAANGSGELKDLGVKQKTREVTRCSRTRTRVSIGPVGVSISTISGSRKVMERIGGEWFR